MKAGCFVLAGIVLSGCGAESLEVGSRYVRAEFIIAAEGGGFVVTATESTELAGVGIQIAPGALARDTLVTLEPFADLMTSSDVERVGPAVRFGPPDAMFNGGVSIQLKLTQELERNAPVVRFETDSDSQDLLAGITEQVGSVSFVTTRFGRFQPGRRPIVGLCQTDADCSLPETCNLTTQRCEDNSSCAVDGDCGVGDVCEGAQCRPGCRGDTQCAAGNICDVPQATCRPGCRMDNGCAVTEICEGMMCRAGCRGDGQCGPTEVCDMATNLCRTGCRSDADCTNGDTCNPATGTCEAPPPPPCRTDNECPNGQTCNLRTFMCE